MTNAEKYLKENVYIEDILSDFGNMYADNELQKSVLIIGLKNFFEAQAKEVPNEKPTLTEDEKVILRNIPKDYKTIGKCVNGVLYVTTDRKIYLDKAFGGFFNHLFQFIQERRRILNTRIVRR